jgi:hypothetical protein
VSTSSRGTPVALEQGKESHRMKSGADQDPNPSVVLLHAIDDAIKQVRPGIVIWDWDEAVQFVHEMTGISVDIVSEILRSKDRYELGLGIVPASDDDLEIYGVTQTELRESHPQLFPREDIEERYVDPGLELEFIAEDTEVGTNIIARVQDAEFEYRRKLGLIYAVAFA